MQESTVTTVHDRPYPAWTAQALAAAPLLRGVELHRPQLVEELPQEDRICNLFGEQSVRGGGTKRW